MGKPRYWRWTLIWCVRPVRGKHRTTLVFPLKLSLWKTVLHSFPFGSTRHRPILKETTRMGCSQTSSPWGNSPSTLQTYSFSSCTEAERRQKYKELWWRHIWCLILNKTRYYNTIGKSTVTLWPKRTCLSLTSWSSFFEVSRVRAKSRTPEVSLSSLWTVWSSEMPRSLPRMKITVLWRKRPQGWTGMEAGLSTTSTSPSSTKISSGLPTTGGSWRCTVFFMRSLFCEDSQESCELGICAF